MFELSTKWVVSVVLVVDLILLAVFLFFRSRRGRQRPSTGFFDFDQYKERELLRRGLLDRAKW
ncbi:MAG: hypothetical protein ACP59X_19735 [Solidesulfovibrio sp. DCME]|uniref:hypothetical protein n=1 Tax=Solidesulfovibrio sp. DCME TaxID=3447380 RepID=UPI003D136414